jgi:hypothetical protein
VTPFLFYSSVVIASPAFSRTKQSVIPNFFLLAFHFLLLLFLGFCKIIAEKSDDVVNFGKHNSYRKCFSGQRVFKQI